ncbi:MAG: TfoX/Sxy family protein [Actinomycetota bacterium]
MIWAGRIREALAGTPEIVGKKMFGGIAFMIRGDICCGVNGDRLMLRMGPKGYERPCPGLTRRPWISREGR